MTTGWIDPFIQHYGLAGLWLDVFLESMGAPLPGETLMIAAAGMAGAGAFDIRAVALVAFVAAVLGDNLGYLIGRRVGRPVVVARGARFGITHERLDRVEAVLDRRGAFVVTVARFFPLLRQLNGLAAGTIGMHWTRFFAANVIGAALWVGIWTWVGFGLGARADLLPAVWHLMYRFAWVLVPLLVIGLFGGWLALRRRRR